MDIDTMAVIVAQDLHDHSFSLLADDDYKQHIERAAKVVTAVSPLRGRSILAIQKECHKQDDTDNAITSAAATSTATANTLLNEIHHPLSTLKGDPNLLGGIGHGRRASR